MNAYCNTVGLAALTLLAACGAPAGHDDATMADHKAMMMADSTAKAQVQAQEETVRVLYEMFNSGKLDGIENHVAENFVDHQMDPSITTTGIQSLRDLVALYHTGMPDVHQEMLSISSTGDRTYVHLHIKGTNTGPWAAMPATGKAMDVLGADVLRFENGKVAEHWGYTEEMKMMQQLGLMPAPGEAPPKK